MEKFRSVFRGTQKLKTEKERGKMKGRIPIKAITMGDTRAGPSSSNTKTREFYKIMVGDFQESLRIPHAFIKRISKEMSGRAVLEGPSGNCWLVKLSSTKAGTYFKDGWETFQRDHSLDFAEFLVFKYNGNMHFKVLIFGVNGCERRDTFVVEPSQGLTFGKGKNCQSPRGDKGKLMSSPRPEVILGTNGCERRATFVVEPSEGLTFGKGKNCQSPRGDKGKLMSSPRPEVILGTNGCERRATFVVEPSEGLTFGKGKNGQSPRGDKGKSMPLPISERRILPEEKTPRFPFFMSTIKVSYVRKPFVMYVPSKFAREHFSRDSRMVRLEDKKGNSWKINLQVRPIQTVFRIGWKKFVEDNHLKAGDSVKFQLVRKAVMKVKIYRGYTKH